MWTTLVDCLDCVIWEKLCTPVKTCAENPCEQWRLVSQINEMFAWRNLIQDKRLLENVSNSNLVNIPFSKRIMYSIFYILAILYENRFLIE